MLAKNDKRTSHHMYCSMVTAPYRQGPRGLPAGVHPVAFAPTRKRLAALGKNTIVDKVMDHQ